jgi:hypothetical protein
MHLTILSASTSLFKRDFKLEGKNSRLREIDLWDWYSEDEQPAARDILAQKIT